MRSDSDTEVLLEACALWGVEAAIERAIGMFAFALWDRATRTLYLARDRLGIKPLYYAATAERVLFASELKALRAVPGWQPTIDDDAVAGYLRHAYIAQPRTIYREASKLPPGHILTLRQGTAPAPQCFWDLRGIAVAGQARNDPAPDANEAVERLDALLRDSVRLRMIADVPLGAFLSGGIDSSTVVALMQAQSTRPVKTFSIGFHAIDYDEAEYAKRVAAHLRTDHTEFYVEPRHALDVIPRLPDWFDEPFADPSQIPTYLVSELTRKHVTVALSGDGGDELFAGYNRYLWAERVARAVSLVPRPLRGPSAALLRALSPAAWNRLFALVPAVVAAGAARRQAAQDRHPARQSRAGRDLSPAGEPMGAAARRSPRAGASRAGRCGTRPSRATSPTFVPRMQYPRYGQLSAGRHSDQGRPCDHGGRARGQGAAARSSRGRLCLDLAVRDSRCAAAAANGCCAACSIATCRRPLIDRPKMGFGVPIDAWLRGPLREWAEQLLAPARLSSYGFVRVEPVRRAWQEHLEGSRNWQYPLWTVLMLQAWRERWA